MPNVLTRARGWLWGGAPILAVALAAALPLPLRGETGPPATVQGDPAALADTALQAVVGQIALDLHDRLVNTVTTVTWPIVPHDPAGPFAPPAETPIEIGNVDFARYNAGTRQDLPARSQNAARIMAELRGDLRDDQFLSLLMDDGVDPLKAGEVAIDRRRVLDILRDYAGAALSLQVVSGTQPLPPQAVPSERLTWSFVPHRYAIGAGSYYVFDVSVVARDVGLTLDPKNGATQSVKVTMTLLPDPNLPVIHAADRSATAEEEGLSDEATSEQTASQEGAGALKPLLLLFGLPSADSLSGPAETALLNNPHVSAIAGIVTSRGGNKSLTGVNALLSETPSRGGLPGVTAGVVDGKGVYVGPSVTLGDGALVLSAGPQFPSQGTSGTQFSGAASLDLSRLLFGKPAPDRTGRSINVSPQQVTGLYTSRQILTGDGVLAVKGPSGAILKVFPGDDSGGGGLAQLHLTHAGRDAAFLTPGRYTITDNGVGRAAIILRDKVVVGPGSVTRVLIPARPPGAGAPAPGGPIPVLPAPGGVTPGSQPTPRPPARRAPTRPAPPEGPVRPQGNPAPRPRPSPAGPRPGPAPGVVSGRVLVHPPLVANVVLELRRPSGRPLDVRSLHDAQRLRDGGQSFRFTGVGPGAYVLVVHVPGDRRVWTKSAGGGPNAAPVTITVDPATASEE
ncbi:MAG: hypothetical protein JO250_20575 [Armatimonadetes bacterium]|nr:hypothetical protein [Armatimonadota bacterium]